MLNMQSVESVDFTGKKVLLRVDFNVELNKKQDVQEQFKLEAPKKTLAHILSFPGVRVALLTHFGRPEGVRNELFSLRPVVDDAERALGLPVHFHEDCVGEGVITAIDSLPEGEVLLLENVRFYPGEEVDDKGFAERLAAPFDIYVNEAFSVCHRAQASVSAIAGILPSYAGLRLSEEVEKLEEVRVDPERPAVAIIGGAKIETKLPLIREFERLYDAVLVGGKVANEAIDEKIEFSDKVLLPRDFQGGDMRLDIGPVTTAMFIEVIGKAKTIVWNGPMGKFEEKPYDSGTNAILHAMLGSEANVVIGGGESLVIIEKADLMHKIGFVSTGGGAMLEYLSGDKLPGLVALKNAAEREV
jgi:3-phosphoglycerate kinase